MLAPEKVLQSRYRIIRQLGQGGMGAVYEALDERLDATVALKETLFTDERLRKQFEREARLLARMHHPALPRVSDHFSEGEGQFLVMQFVAGEDLSHMMAHKQGPFPPAQVLTWGDQLLDALDYLHTQDPQIIHRDIKPQNLKITARGQIILLDFGLAKGQTAGVSVVTTSASIFGYTPNYAPLEQIQGLGTDARSDIYALSATLYHLMTSVKPPDALTRAAALVNGLPDPLIPANEISSSIGPEVASLLARGMSQNRDQRYATAAEMRAALKGTGEAATLAGRAEAATVIFQPLARTFADAASTDAEPTAIKTGVSAKQTAIKIGETTVVQEPKGRRTKRLAPWAIGASALILIGVLFGGFYAYQHRNNPSPTVLPNSPAQENTAIAEPSTTGTAAATEPGSGTVTEEKEVDTSTQRAETIESAKKTEKAARNNEKITDKPSRTYTAPVPNIQTPPRVADRYPDAEPDPSHPAVPEINAPDASRMDQRRRRMGGATIRNLPDGSKLITSPDGTRVLVMPDGTQRIFRPGGRIPRRRRVG